MRAFITGIAGFVGTHLARHLQECGDEVYGSVFQSKDNRFGDNVIEWDIMQPLAPAVTAQLQKIAPDVIYHLAAMSKAEDCGEDLSPTREAARTNIYGTGQVLVAMLSLPRSTKLVFASSSHVYPRSESTTLVSEYTSTAPHSAYGQTKLLAEMNVQTHVMVHGRDAVIARAFQHTGPGQSTRFMLPEWCEGFAKHDGTPVTIRNSETWLDLCDVRDVVRAYRLLAERGSSGEIYNVGSGRAVKSGDVFDKLREIADPTRPTQSQSSEVKYEPIADISKLTAATGWRPEITLEQTIRDTYAAVSAT